MGLCLLAKLFNGALSATHTRSILLLKKNESSHQLWVFNGTLMGLCLLAKFLMGPCLLAYCIILLLKNESSRTAVLFNGALSADGALSPNPSLF